MSTKYQWGERVFVLKDEGHDLPDDVQGKYANILEPVGESEYRITTDDGKQAVAAYYHVVPAFVKGQLVTVVADCEDPKSGWVGAIGRISSFTDHVYVVHFRSGIPYPEEGHIGWFAGDELSPVTPAALEAWLHDTDPDLQGFVHEAMQRPDLQGYSFTTALLVLAHAGVSAMQDDPNFLKGSGIFPK